MSAARATKVAAAAPRFFAGAAAFRAWLAKHHATSAGLVVGFHRVASGRGGLTYPEALDEALCVGWIDGLRRGLDAASYSIRFSPRKPDSVWSQVNLRHVARLEKAGRMKTAGRAAVAKRDPAKVYAYSYETRRAALPAAFAARLASDAKARADWDARPPSYRRAVTRWIVTAKQEATRARRFATLLECSRRGRKVPPMDFPKTPPAAARAAARTRPPRKG